MIENNKYTVMAMEKIFDGGMDDWEVEGYLFDSTEYAMELDRRNPVLEGVVERLNQLDVQVTCEDKKEIVKEINSRYINMGIGEGVPRTVRNWISGTPVNPAYRENLYNLCMALEMNTEQVKAFFLKNYMTIPFNFKDRVDAIYYYGISRSLSYVEILQLLSEFKDDEDRNSDCFENTRLIGNYIMEIDDIEVFREYLRYNSYGRKKQYETAANAIVDLAVENAGYAEKERSLSLRDGLRRKKESKHGDLLSEPIILKENKAVNYKALLFVIYGYDNQERYANKKAKMSKCEYLPKAFRENFPNDQEFSRIVNREASPDVYRKALMIMKFYNFFCSSMLEYMYGTDKPEEKDKKTWDDYLERDDEDITADWEDFRDETGLLLSQCGFEQMYARNPFDWLMLYCAKSTDPMQTFRDLLAYRFIDMYDE